MAEYTETKEVDQIIVEPLTGTVLWRIVTVGLVDGVEVHRKNERGSVMADDDKHQGVPPEVAAYRALAVTPEKIAAARARREAAAMRAPITPQRP